MNRLETCDGLTAATLLVGSAAELFVEKVGSKARELGILDRFDQGEAQAMRNLELFLVLIFTRMLQRLDGPIMRGKHGGAANGAPALSASVRKVPNLENSFFNVLHYPFVLGEADKRCSLLIKVQARAYNLLPVMFELAFSRNLQTMGFPTQMAESLTNEFLQRLDQLVDEVISHTDAWLASLSFWKRNSIVEGNTERILGVIYKLNQKPSYDIAWRMSGE